MKLKTLTLTALICLSSALAYGNDSLRIAYQKVHSLESELKVEVTNREKLAQSLDAANAVISEQKAIIDSLCLEVKNNKENISSTADKLGVQLQETNTNLESKASTDDVANKTIWGCVIALVLAILGAIVYFILHKRINKGNADVDELKLKAEKLNEEILNQFSQEMTEMQKISSSLAAIEKTTGKAGATTEPDHSLIKTLADRITFMEMTLFKMDPKVKGFKQLSKSISQMKDNLLANGYELVSMLGKPYNDGMKAIANFNDDEEIEAGKRIITAIIKPQINYKGQMIQAAQITVSQNI